MNTFIDCPNCGSEFVVSDDMTSSNLRCPDCLQWVNSFYEDATQSGRHFVASYSSGASEYWDDFGYQDGYDY